MAFSTESSLAKVWRVEDVKAEVIGSYLGLSGADAEREVAKLRAALADPDRVRAMLAELPAPSLAVLALLADHAGLLPEDELVAQGKARFGFERREVIAAIGPLLRALFVVQLRGPWAGPGIALVDRAVGVVLARVVDLDLPSLSAAPFVPAPDADGGRALLAACAALRQIDAKRTASGLPHRGATRRLAKQLGADEDDLDALFAIAVTVGLATWDANELLRPDFSRMSEAATGRYDHEPRVAALVAHVVTAPLSSERIARWLARATPRGERVLTVEQLGRLPGFCAGAVGDRAAIASAPVGGKPAASVTPSFEVFLPPESPVADVVAVLRVAELVRIDRVIVARLTKGSVGRAAGDGMSARDIVAALGEACRTPLPQNVEVAIHDWVGSIAAVKTAVGRVVVVAVADQGRATAALAAWSPTVLAPGVIVVAETAPARAVAAALAGAGLHVRAESVAQPVRSGAPLPPIADSALRARLDAYRAGDPDELRLVPKGTPAGGVPSGAVCPDCGRVHADEDDGDVVTVSATTMDRLERWERDRRVELADETFGMVGVVLDALAEHDRRYVLDARHARELDDRIHHVLKRGGMQSFLAKHARAIERAVPEVANQLARSAEQPAYDWHTSGMLARLQAAARTHAKLVLDLGSRTPTVAISRLLPRGTTTIVLGEDASDGSDVAVPLSAIRAVADPPDRRWRPVQGERTPAGHEPCPCASGKRYRNCCREPS